VAPEGVGVNIEKVQARVTAMTLVVEEAAPKDVRALPAKVLESLPT